MVRRREAESLYRPAEMGGRLGLKRERAFAGRMRQREPAGMQVKPPRVGHRREQRFLAAILAVAQDRTSDLGAMDAQLMGAAGARPQRQQRGPVAGPIEDAEMGQRLLPLL